MDKSLLNAAKKGELSKAITALDQGANINVRDERNFTPLYLTAASRNLALVDTLCWRGADLEQRCGSGEKRKDYIDKIGKTPLIIVSQPGYLDVVKILIRYGANIETTNNGFGGGDSPIITASVEGHSDIVNYLITNISQFDKQCTNPYLTARCVN